MNKKNYLELNKKKFDTGLPQLEDARDFTSNLHNDQILILVPNIKCDSSKVNPFKGKKNT